VVAAAAAAAEELQQNNPTARQPLPKAFFGPAFMPRPRNSTANWWPGGTRPFKGNRYDDSEGAAYDRWTAYGGGYAGYKYPDYWDYGHGGYGDYGGGDYNSSYGSYPGYHGYWDHYDGYWDHWALGIGVNGGYKRGTWKGEVISHASNLHSVIQVRVL
jgi:hypothetical protein